ncbi:MAG: GNAT family N-acetyltransferase [Chloroflexi bacterium]|nr:GNAT family N-acetyltransferase [Chloroflexota bacterium]
MITIRRIQIGEAALYRQIRLAALKDAPYAFQTTYDSAFQRTDEMWRDRVERTAQGMDEAIFLAFSDGLPVGIAALIRRKDQAEAGELMQVWVEAEHRGTSAAWDLMDSIFQWAKGNHFRKVMAGVTKVNTRALRFYTRYGFSRMEESAQSDPDSVYLVKEITRDA